MSKNKKTSNEVTIRSSAAEYLTFIASTGDNPQSFEMRYEDENIWLTQKMMAVLYDVSVQNIGQHIKKILDDSELSSDSVIKNYFITADDGKKYDTRHYNLQMVIAVGFKVDNERAVQFRKWANHIVKDYTIKGWVMDAERLKHGGSILTDKYFEEQLDKIREIRLSERKFYQKVTDIYTTALDYDATAKTTQAFFKKVQNKLHYAVHGNTAVEVVYNRADANKKQMGLTSWAAAPDGKIQKHDVVIAKNYLSEEELQALNNLVEQYLIFAEGQAMRRIPMAMHDWIEKLHAFLTINDRDILFNAGRISHELAKEKSESEYEKFHQQRIRQNDALDGDFDKYVKKLNPPKQKKRKTKE